MNTKIGIAILAVACFGFAVALVVFKHQADMQQTESANTIADFSNQIVKANVNIEDLNQANLNLSSDLATNREMSLALSNQLAETAVSLATTTVSLQDAQQQITNLNGRISDLEAQNQVLDQRASSLSNTIAALDTQITLTQTKLAASETNNAFLDSQLKEQIAQRTELERKFNDLAQVRTQVRKLRDDLLVERRLAWMRAGIDPNKPLKGGQLLVQRPPPAANAAPAAGSTLYNLNVEVGSDGSVHVIPPLTNSPAPASPPSN
jgi:predicted RNase H-like nuclease (RuvC/YqgF family)